MYALHTTANSLFLTFQFSHENKQKMSVCTGPSRFEAWIRASAPFREAEARHTHREPGFALPPAGPQSGEKQPPGGSAEPLCAHEQTWENVGPVGLLSSPPSSSPEPLSSSTTLPSLGSSFNDQRLIGCVSEFWSFKNHKSEFRATNRRLLFTCQKLPETGDAKAGSRLDLLTEPGDYQLPCQYLAEAGTS